VVKIRMLIYTPTSRGGSVSNRWSGSLTGRCKQHKAILVAEGLGLVGERRNAGIIHLAMRSRATKRPNNLEINSPSSSGKTFTVLTVLALESPEAFYELTAGSERALIFNGESLRHRMIYFQEPEGLAEGVGAAVIKSLIWEGRLRYDTVIKDASGKFVGQHIEKDGPTGLIITTTIPLEEQFTNRLFRIEVNDSEEQTRLILEAIADSVNGYRTQLTCRSGMLFRNSWVNRKR
jgi:hypothetical protein